MPVSDLRAGRPHGSVQKRQRNRIQGLQLLRRRLHLQSDFPVAV
jgi:hypothetical protein